MSRFRIFCLAVALLGFVWVAEAQTTTYPLDDFLCYNVISDIASFSADVYLSDDIALPTATAATVGTARDFCNAAELAMGKKRTAIDNPADDLTFYEVDFPSPPVWSLRSVQLNNFFGSQAIDILNPTRLAVPTGKVPAPIPTQLDHFLCYTASGAMIRKRLAATDLWMRERVLVGFPSLFCNPVEKVTPVQPPDQHLVCYVIAEQTFAPNPNVIVTNQFNVEQTLGVQSLDLLCVPSTVESVAPAQVVE